MPPDEHPHGLTMRCGNLATQESKGRRFGVKEPDDSQTKSPKRCYLYRSARRTQVYLVYYIRCPVQKCTLYIHVALYTSVPCIYIRCPVHKCGRWFIASAADFTSKQSELVGKQRRTGRTWESRGDTRGEIAYIKIIISSTRIAKLTPMIFAWSEKTEVLEVDRRRQTHTKINYAESKGARELPAVEHSGR